MNLEEIRNQINTINNELLRLFEKRMNLCKEVAFYKQAHQMEVFVAAREVEIMEWVDQTGVPELRPYDLEFFNCLLSQSRVYQQKIIGTESGFPTQTPSLKTERLLLLPLGAEDAEPLFSLTSDPQITQYMRFDRHTNLEQTKKLIASYCTPNNLAYKILIGETSELIGAFVLSPSKENPSHIDISTFIGAEHWNNGYSSEILAAAKDVASQLLHADSLWAYVVLENKASGHVLKKMGFQVDHTLTFENWDGVLEVYRLDLEK